MADGGYPRIASNVTQNDWGDPNAYPLDASGTGVTFLLPQALINEGVKKIGIVRVDLAAASAIVGLLEPIYKATATFPYDPPVPGGTTDYSQFILGAQNAGADGMILALGDQEAIQIVRAGQQLGTDLQDRLEPRLVLAQVRSGSSATSPSTWSSCGRSRRRP